MLLTTCFLVEFDFNCFKNDVLQVFHHTPELINYFRNFTCSCGEEEEKQDDESENDCGPDNRKKEKNTLEGGDANQDDKLERLYNVEQMETKMDTDNDYEVNMASKSKEKEKDFVEGCEMTHDRGVDQDSEEGFYTKSLLEEMNSDAEDDEDFDWLAYFESDEFKEESELDDDSDSEESNILTFTEVDEENNEDICYPCLVKEYLSTFERCALEKKDAIRPKNFLKTIMDNSIYFTFNETGDADEFFMDIADKLDGPNTKSVIEEIFDSKVLTVYKCKTCDHEWRFAFHWRNDCKRGDVRQRLAEMCGEKDCDTKRTCEECNALRECTERTVIRSPPQILSLRVLDFRLHGKTPTTFPEKIDIRPYMEDRSGASVYYELYAAIMATPVTYSDVEHYFSYCKTPGGQWNLYNDMVVTEASIEDVLNCDPYFLFYRRSSGDDCNVEEKEEKMLKEICSAEEKECETQKLNIQLGEISAKRFYGS